MLLVCMLVYHEDESWAVSLLCTSDLMPALARDDDDEWFTFHFQTTVLI